MTTRISGTPAAVINTPYVQKMGLNLPWYLQVLKNQKLTKKYVVPLIHWTGMKQLEAAAIGPTWKTVWSAGQSVGLVNEILSCQEIMDKLVTEYQTAIQKMPRGN
jgi:nitronate monooxygenase